MSTLRVDRMATLCTQRQDRDQSACVPRLTGSLKVVYFGFTLVLAVQVSAVQVSAVQVPC